jgi:mercuric ion transport protein
MRPSLRWADSAGVLGAVSAALCCAGAPVIISVLAAVGLSWLRRDSILWPLMAVSLGIALWGFWTERRTHGVSGPLALAGTGAVGLVAGVVFVHGPPSRWLIDASAIVLVATTVWNIRARMTCRPPTISTAASG